MGRKLSPVMTESSKPDFSDFTALAAEACDLWQEHLSSYAQNPENRMHLMSFVEPQRQLLSRLFTDYTAMMQKARYDQPPKSAPSSKSDGSSADNAESAPFPTRTAATGAAPDDTALRLAQLAHRVAQLEQHIAELDKRLAQTGPRKNPRSRQTD